ncbi:MAG: hypothetical protein ACYCZF_03350 [Anaerolineae bacterium]
MPTEFMGKGAATWPECSIAVSDLAAPTFARLVRTQQLNHYGHVPCQIWLRPFSHRSCGRSSLIAMVMCRVRSGCAHFRTARVDTAA